MPQTQLDRLTVSSFQKNPWATDQGSGASLSISFWVPNVPSGYSWLGMFATNNYLAPPSGNTVLVKAENDDPSNPLLAPPLGFSPIWQYANLGIFMPIPPSGYLALGAIAVPSRFNQPIFSNYPGLMCVRQDQCQQVTVDTPNFVWNDQNSGAPENVTVWLLPTASVASAVSGYPSSTVVWDLKATS